MKDGVGGRKAAWRPCLLTDLPSAGREGGAEITVAPRCGTTEMVTWPEFITHAVGFWVCLGFF